MKKLAIFDMDGTLFNTSDVNFYAYKEALEKYDISIDYEYYCNKCNGRHYSVFIPPLVDYDKIKTEDIHNSKKKLYVKYLDKVKINKLLIDIITKIKEDYFIAIVTTASKENTYELLNYTKTKQLFDLVLTADDINQPKPNPEGFLKALEYFDIDASNCMIFEDSDVGIKGALFTGATVFKVEFF